MPTGYTADVQSGEITDLREFALRCARGMGALIMMRDDPMSAPIPERFEPSRYNADRLAEDQAELDAVTTMSREEASAEADKAYHAGCVAFDQRRAERAEHARRYEAMIAKVEAWETKADGIREFMLDQLRQSLDFDCKPVRADSPFSGKPQRQTGEEWRAARVEELTRSIAYHAKANAEEITRTEARNRWLADLRASLPAAAEREASQ